MTAKILIVDDEPELREIVALRISKTNFEILAQLDSGNQTINYLEQNKSNLPDIILSDARMKDGSGLDILLYCKKNFPQIKFCFLSGQADITTEGAYAHGACAIYNKPTDFKILNAHLKFLVSGIERILITDTKPETTTNPAFFKSEKLLLNKTLEEFNTKQNIILGRGGISIFNVKCPINKINTNIYFDLEVENFPNIQGKGQIRWIRSQTKNSATGKISPLGFGLEIEELNKDSKYLLKEIEQFDHSVHWLPTDFIK